MCWEWTDFCDVRQLADGQFSQSASWPGSQLVKYELYDYEPYF